MQNIHKALLFIVTTMGCSTLATAQVRGIVKMDGGLGTAQNKAEVDLHIDSGVTLNPFFGIAGVDKEKWNLQSDQHLVMKADGSEFVSTRDVEYDGHTLFYGTDFACSMGRHHIKGSVLGNNVRMDGTGTLDEPNYQRDLNLPSRDADIYHADASYLLNMWRKGETLEVKYIFDYKKLSETEEERYADNSDDGMLNIQQSSKERKSDVSIAYNTPLSASQALNVGIAYENRQLNSDDSQMYIGRQPWVLIPPVGSSLDYHTDTYRYHLAYNLKKGAVAANARVEYHHTILPSVKLDDVVPTVRVAWNMTKSQSLTAQYLQRIIRPDLDKLNPFERRYGGYEVRYGNTELRGVHVNNAALIYQYKQGEYDFKTTLSHIFANDGFNGLWFENASRKRVYTWGNEGKRRAWSVSPDFTWTPSMQTKVYAKGTLIWDKRVADAIDMAYEHWGVTAEVGGTHEFFGKELYVNAHARYSEGNTLDLYSHEGRSMKLGGFVDKYFLDGKLGCKLAYDYTEYARIVIVQGVNGVGPTRSLYGWTGSEYRRPKSRHNLTASISYSF